MLGFIDGNLGLAKTFWLFGVLGTLIMKLILTIMMLRGIDSTLCFIIGIAYSTVIWIAIWNSANQYQGSKSTVLSAKALVVLAVLMSFAEFNK